MQKIEALPETELRAICKQQYGGSYQKMFSALHQRLSQKGACRHWRIREQIKRDKDAVLAMIIRDERKASRVNS